MKSSLKEVKQKYLYGFKNKLLIKRKKNFLKKINKIPKRFFEVFNEESYLKANPDIKEAIKKGEFVNAIEHFIFFGFNEVKEGKRRIGKEFSYFNEVAYKIYNPDLKIEKDKNPAFDLYKHFLEYGYKEYLDGLRIGIGYFPFEFDEKLQKDFKSIFDENSYVASNGDVKEAIEKGVFKNGWEHFVNYGVYEIQRGEKKIHIKIPKFNEIEYLIWFDDVQKLLKEKIIASPFIHFLKYGYKQILEGKRVLPNSTIYIYYELKLTEEIKKEIKNFQKKPLISIIMPVFNVECKWLEKAIKSVENQWYDNWELCIADDASTKKETKEFLKTLKNPKIKIKFLDKNLGISGASNEALKMAEGEYIALMDNDDELTPDALYEVVKVINEKGAEFIYSDEDKIEMSGEFVEPHFKPDFAPDMFLSQNYISHLGVIKKELIDKVGGFEVGLEGSQDYDLYLKVLEHTDKIYHIPKVLYHWRKIPGSTAAEYTQKSYAQEAGRKALENAMKRRGIKAKVKNGLTPGTYKVEYEIKGEPLVSIVIPYKDKPELLRQCIGSILEKTTYKNFEIIGISNNSKEKKTFEEMERLKSLDERVKFYEYNIPFNYSKINNYAVENFAKGEYIVFMNNDIEIITQNWIEEMLMFAQRDNVGAVGAKLYYPDNTIQHAGVILGIGGVAGHSHKYFKKDDNGYFSRPHIIQNLSAVTAALMMVKKEKFLEVGGFDEENLKVAFNDVDFCLKLREKGYLNVYTPYVEAIHYESKSRGLEDTKEKHERFQKEIEYMKKKWKNMLKYDKFYNPNLTLQKEDFSLKGKNE